MAKEIVVDEKPEPKEVIVNLDEHNNPVPPPVAEEPKYVRLEDLEKINQAINNTREFNNRKTASIEKQLAEISQTLKAPRTPMPTAPGQTKDELDEMLERGDWRTPVTKLSEQKARELYKQMRDQEKEEDRIQAETAQTARQLNDNKQTVLKRHKELEDENSPKAQIYRAILQERPEYLTNAFGPVLAMRDMEDRMKEMGIIDEPTSKVVDKEVLRRARTGASGVPTGISQTGPKKFILSKEQRELCDLNGWKYESYAKHASILNQKKEIEA